MNQKSTVDRFNESSAGAPYPVKRPSGFFALLGGTINALWSAVVAAVMLLVNGSIAVIILGAVTDGNPEWSERKGVMQFGLFVIPLAMLLAEWLIWDFLRGLLAKPSEEQDR